VIEIYTLTTLRFLSGDGVKMEPDAEHATWLSLLCSVSYTRLAPEVGLECRRSIETPTMQLAINSLRSNYWLG